MESKDLNPAEENTEESFGFLDIFNYEEVFKLIELRNDGDPTFWIWVGVYYVILMIPCWIVVRAALFLILPKSWLKKLFKI